MNDYDISKIPVSPSPISDNNKLSQSKTESKKSSLEKTTQDIATSKQLGAQRAPSELQDITNKRRMSTLPPSLTQIMTAYESRNGPLPKAEKMKLQIKLTTTYKIPYSPDFPQPTANMHPKMKINPDEEYILWRGTRAVGLAGMCLHQSAGGNQPANPSTSAPTEKEVKSQVGEQESFPEFTDDPNVAIRFSTNNQLVAVKIQGKYFAPGSVSESGWVVKREAPLEVLAWTDGRKL